MVLLHFIPVTALIVQNSTQLSTVVTNLREAGETKLQVGFYHYFFNFSML